MASRAAPRDSGGKRQTIASAISAHLRDAIVRGDLRPGAKLHIDDLRMQFAVSLSPLREALSRLGSAGLVEIEDQRGYRVAPVSDANLAEIIALRMEMEGIALRQAMALGRAEWRDGLEQALAVLTACVSTPGDEHRNEIWERAHRNFHLTLLAGCGMPVLLGFITSLHDQSDRYRRIFLQSNPRDRDVPEEHRRVYQAVIEGETELACALLRQHIQRTGANSRAALGRSAESGRGD